MNADCGEGFGHDRALLQIVTSANICCGAHAGSPDAMLATVEHCRAYGVRIGAHPGYPDRENMGRKSLRIETNEQVRALAQEIVRQVECLASLAAPKYVKPHGALYNDSTRIGPHTEALEIAIERLDLPLMGLSGSAHAAVADAVGVPFIREGFADRRYGPNDRLVPRSSPDAILSDPDEIRSQAITLAMQVDSICIHGDSEGCVEIAELVRATLTEAGHVIA